MQSSKNPDEAWQYVTYLASREVRKNTARVLYLYGNRFMMIPELIAQQPEIIKVAKEQIPYVFDRPQLSWYSQFSVIMVEELQAALSGAKAPGKLWMKQ